MQDRFGPYFIVLVGVLIFILSTNLSWSFYGNWTKNVIVDPNSGKVICYVGQVYTEKDTYMYSNCPMYKIEGLK